MPAAERKASFWEQVAGLPANFWFANLMEMFERLAFFGSRAIAPLYLVAESNRNGLGLSYTDKGWIYFWWALIQCIVPMVSGGYTERYGYRRSLAAAFVINAIGYSGMALSKPITDHLVAGGWGGGPEVGFWVFFAAACMVALGTAIFKPPVHGTIARTTTEETSSLGWGVFYWAVNIGGALAPMAAAELRGEINWNYVFYGAAIVTLCNFLPCFLLYREPEKAPRPVGEKQKGPFGVFFSSIFTIFKDLRLVVFLLIFSCFWLMFMQLWDLLPNFIEEWVDTSDVAGLFGWIRSSWVLENGQTKPEIMINIDAWAIIALVLVISWIVRKIHKVAAMIVGMVISLVGFVGAGMTQIGVVCAIMIFVFSIGEMACSPTFSAYVGLIAPKDKKALYMGYSNIPFAIGWALGSSVGGYLYEDLSNIDTLARRYLVDQAMMTREFADNRQQLPKGEALGMLARLVDGASAKDVAATVQTRWTAIQVEGLPADQVVTRMRDLYSTELQPAPAKAMSDARLLLWNAYHPYRVWLYLGALGLAGTIGMILFYVATRHVRVVNGEETAPAQT
ncbi:MAG TPA: MFS transporter [Phycisphaerae bacterium]|nr:MFS transporter [Phycisphaerae bacterium]HNU45673.1 MFS transporter [Phycisphaerae bacterium]